VDSFDSVIEDLWTLGEAILPWFFILLMCLHCDLCLLGLCPFVVFIYLFFVGVFLVKSHFLGWHLYYQRIKIYV
jgi:hypothetical protein